MGIFRNKQITLTDSLDLLKILFHFTYIEPLFALGNMFSFFDLKFKYVFNFLFSSLLRIVQTVGGKFGSIQENLYLFHYEYYEFNKMKF